MLDQMIANTNQINVFSILKEAACEKAKMRVAAPHYDA